jgi:hypothetical protein
LIDTEQQVRRWIWFLLKLFFFYLVEKYSNTKSKIKKTIGNIYNTI